MAAGAASLGGLALAGVGVLAALSAGALRALVQLVVQVGVPLGLMGYVAWRRLQAIWARRAETKSADRSLVQVALRQGRAALARGIAVFGGGFYGLVAAGAFLVYQVHAVPDTWRALSSWHVLTLRWPSDGLAFLTETVGGALWGMVLDVGTGWVDGFVFAMVWPLHLMDLVGPLGLAVAMGAGVGVFHLARRLVPGAEAFAQDVEEADPASVWSPLPEELMPEDGETAPEDPAAGSSHGETSGKETSSETASNERGQ